LDRSAFIQVCSDLSSLAAHIKRRESAERFSAMADEARRKFWWNRKDAAVSFYAALRAMFLEKAAA
jgi:hypothetical protein